MGGARGLLRFRSATLPTVKREVSSQNASSLPIVKEERGSEEASPAGIEPAPPAPEAGALSVELRGQMLSQSFFNLIILRMASNPKPEPSFIPFDR